MASPFWANLQTSYKLFNYYILKLLFLTTVFSSILILCSYFIILLLTLSSCFLKILSTFLVSVVAVRKLLFFLYCMIIMRKWGRGLPRPTYITRPLFLILLYIYCRKLGVSAKMREKIGQLVLLWVTLLYGGKSYFLPVVLFLIWFLLICACFSFLLSSGVSFCKCFCSS